MINLQKINEYNNKLENKTNEEKEKLIYEWIKNKTISLGEFRSLVTNIRRGKNNNEHRV